MKLLIDMNLSPRWAGTLTDAGFETAHWSTLGPANTPDHEIMAFAVANDHVVLTNDLDFGAILAAANAEKPSVVQVRAENLQPEAIGEQVIEALRRMNSELEGGALVTIDTKKTRLRILPLQSRNS